MKKGITLFFTFLLVVTMLVALPLNASAANTATQDGLEIAISTDKTEYSANEDIQVSVNIKNTNSYKVENVSIETQLPDGLVLKSGEATVDNIIIDAGNAYSNVVVAKLADNSGNNTKPDGTTKPDNAEKPDNTAKPDSTTKPDDTKKPDTQGTNAPKTGDTLNVVFWAILLIAAVIGVILTTKYKKKVAQALSVMLCLTMVLSIIPMSSSAVADKNASLNTHSAAAANNTATPKAVTVDKTITVDGKEYVVKAEVCFTTAVSAKSHTVSFNLNYDGAPNNIPQQSVEDGKNAKYPCIPTREKYTFAGWYADKNETDLTNQYDFTQPISSDTTLYAQWVDINLDSDGDKIPDDLEPYFESDPHKKDTDSDGLDDYEECVILGTHPNKTDSDNNGTNDYDEDADKDGLSNGYEFGIQTNPIAIDTDLDNITDFDELNGTEYKTDPKKADTDNDGANDDWEIENKFNPLVYNDDFNVVVESKATNTTASATVELPGKKAMSLSVEPILEHPVLSDTMPGYIDVPFEFTVDENLEGATATISFSFDETLSSSPDFKPTIYYYDDVNQTLEELPTTVENNVASATVSHFSSYILLNKTEFDKVWENEIKKPILDGSGTAFTNIDVAFAIDVSGSMSGDRIRTAKSALNSFIDALTEKDRAALIKFSEYSTVLCDLTTDKDQIKSKIDSLSAYGLTSMYRGLGDAVELLTKDNEQYGYKMIIILSDGRDEPSSDYQSDYADLVAKAVDNDIIVYTIGVGSGIDTSVLTKLAEETGGAYYHATSSTEITDIFFDLQEETVDLTTDTDNDKIPDYYETRLTNGGGVHFDLDINNPDCDGDGLLDGEEIVITTDKSGKVYGKVKSNPLLANSDSDIYTDYDEVKKYASNPMIKNVAFSDTDTNFLINNENFVSDKYMDFYENKWYGWLERVSLWIGNNVFGSNYDTTYMYKTILMEYLQNMVSESESANEIREVIGLTHKILSQMNEHVNDAVKNANAVDKIELDSLRKLLNQKTEELCKIANNMANSPDDASKQIFELWDDTFAEYNKVYEKIPTLKKKIEINTKIGKASDVVGVVLDVVDVVVTGYDFYKTYSDFAASISGMENCLETLKILETSPDAPDELKTAAKELYRVIEEQKLNNLDTFFDALGKVGGKIANITITGVAISIPVVGPYIAAAKLVLGIGDFIFNVSEVSEQCACLYAISKSSSILADNFSKEISNGTNKNSWIVIYDGYTGATDKYFSLAIMRKTSENQMKAADEANSFLIEWLFTEFMYKVDTINANVDKIDSIKKKYVPAGAC